MTQLKILIADDEEFLQELYEMILETELPCQFIKVFNANNGIDALKSDPTIDLIISDYNMPGSNGGKLYLYNKENLNIPFFLMSGGILKDYQEFNQFKETNLLNQFFNKPFDEQELITAAKNILAKKKSSVANTDAPLLSTQYIKVKLSHYLDYTASSTEIYIKLSDEKFTKITNINPDNLPEIDLLKHYQGKGIEFIYIEKTFFNSLIHEMFDHFHQNLFVQNKKEEDIKLGGIQFKINSEGLRDIGFTNFQIEMTNDIIEGTIDTLLQNTKTQDEFKNFCEKRGFAIGHSILLIYIANRICLATDLNVASTMKKMAMAAFYHDLSLFDSDAKDDELKLHELSDPELCKKLVTHPSLSAEFLSDGLEVIGDIKKIILEHHELPDGDGYPKKLTAQQISPLSCLFILSHQITLCLLRNHFSKDRLKDFLSNSSKSFNQGNFAKFFKASETIFGQDT